MTEDIRIADKVAYKRLAYPNEFASCRDRWLEFIQDPSADTGPYVQMVTEHVDELEGSTVPEDERADLIVGAFWAAAADAALNERADRAANAADNLYEALAEIW